MRQTAFAAILVLCLSTALAQEPAKQYEPRRVSGWSSERNSVEVDSQAVKQESRESVREWYELRISETALE